MIRHYTAMGLQLLGLILTGEALLVYFGHILSNLFTVYVFGSELEMAWGTREFTKFCFLCGIGAALTGVIAGPHCPIPIIGASDAIFGLLLAYGLLFPDRIIYPYTAVP